MRIALICIASTLVSQPLTAEEPTISDLTQKIELLERELTILKGHVATTPQEDGLGELVINVTREGRIVAGEKIIEDADLVEKLKAVNAQYSDQPLQIRGHEDTKYRDIVRVIGLCHKAGSWVISFATIKNETNKAEMATPRKPSD